MRYFNTIGCAIILVLMTPVAFAVTTEKYELAGDRVKIITTTVDEATVNLFQLKQIKIEIEKAIPQVETQLANLKNDLELMEKRIDEAEKLGLSK